ncbi:glycosyltransferase family 2 protein [Sphingomonas sp. Ag1]|jgi:glycosyltransferase involved in cell wall biosynthesis|uniref:glycosyltransferase family 2 protein n=1 Tax=Sphingomonas sp. Ag1 TaxID=1642949 RepID=UPI00069856BC|nr:glycosyltransferase family 2 protein [Sphingomonas sp. Ag1]
MPAAGPAQGGVSILVATYNGARYLADQMDSILAQVAPDDEVIVVDDGSSDTTFAMLSDYAARFPCVTALRNDRNMGVRKTFERLLGLSTRNIVFLSDQDDIWIEGRKARMIEALQQGGCVAVLANSLVMTDEGIGRSFFPEGHRPDVGSVARTFVRNPFIGCCMAFRREVLAVALPFPASISMHDWWIGTCAMAIGEVRYVAAPSLLYRRHGANQSSSTRRSWRVVLNDRRGNLLALAALAARLVRLRRQQHDAA